MDDRLRAALGATLMEAYELGKKSQTGKTWPISDLTIEIDRLVALIETATPDHSTTLLMLKGHMSDALALIELIAPEEPEEPEETLESSAPAKFYTGAKERRQLRGWP